jgi:hypothetical protein
VLWGPGLAAVLVQQYKAATAKAPTAEAVMWQGLGAASLVEGVGHLATRMVQVHVVPELMCVRLQEGRGKESRRSVSTDRRKRMKIVRW